jgi:hypothetical protein
MNQHYNNMAVNAFQVRNYRIDHINGQSFNEPIEEINTLATHLRYYINEVAQVTFFFHNNHQPFHHLILRKTQQGNNRFVIEFYHYYNEQVERVERSLNQQHSDFASVVNAVNQSPWLRENFHRLVIDPFYVAPLMT